MAAATVALISLIPLAFVVTMIFVTGPQESARLIFRARVGDLLINTGLLEVLAVPVCAVLATTLAWLTERTDLPAARVFAWLAVAPLAVPAFVHSYAWVSAVPSLHGLSAGLLVSVLAYFPFIYLPVAAQLRRLDPATEESARALGLAPVAVFFRVVLPQLRLSLCGGGLLVGLHLLAEYGLFAMVRFDTLSTAIVDQFQSSFNGPAANMLASILVTACLLLLVLENGLRGNARYARLGSGSPAPAARQRLGRMKLPALGLTTATVILSLGVPLWIIGRWLYAGSGFMQETLTLTDALTQTMMLGIIGGALASAAALPVAWLSVRKPDRLVRLLEACHYYVGSLPGAVVGLALVTLTVQIMLPLYQTYVTLLLAYMLLFLPRALIGLRASLAQTPVELEEAAIALGRSPRRAIWEVTMRLAAPGIAVSICLAGLGIVNELTATLMLAPIGTRTLATQFWSLTSELDYAAAAPYAAMMVALSLPMTTLLFVQSRKAIGQ